MFITILTIGTLLAIGLTLYTAYYWGREDGRNDNAMRIYNKTDWDKERRRILKETKHE